MNSSNVIPPGNHPYDPKDEEIDPIGFSLGRIQTYLTWIEEHRASFEANRASDSAGAEKELRDLAYSTKKALRHFQRLVELLLAGYQIDSKKRLPRNLFLPAWLSWLRMMLENPA
jgi:hypothetical protein